MRALPYNVTYSRAEASHEKSCVMAFLTSAFQSAGWRKRAGGAADGAEQILDGEGVEDESGAAPTGGVELDHGVGEPARAAHDRHRPVAERDELAEAAGLVARGHQEAVGPP